MFALFTVSDWLQIGANRSNGHKQLRVKLYYVIDPLNMTSTCVYHFNAVPSTVAQIGDTGFTGPMGASGATGLQGDPGTIGPMGNTGSTGPLGQTGASGFTGPEGPTGATGQMGPMGELGRADATGPQGTSFRHSAVNLYEIKARSMNFP